MKTEPIVIFISEMNIDLEMKHHNKMEMKKEFGNESHTSHRNEVIHHVEMNQYITQK